VPTQDAVDRRAASTGRPVSRDRRFLRHAPDLIAAIAALLGVLSLVDAFLPHERLRVHAITRVIPVPATAAASAVLAVAGLLLLRVAAGLRKRKRRAWQVAMVVALVMLVAFVVRGERRPDELAITALLIGLLIAARSRFTAKADPFSRWLSVRVFVQIICVAYAYGLGILYLYPHRIVGHRSFTLRLEEVSLGLVGTPGNLHFSSDLFADVLHGTLLGFGLFAVAAFALLVLRAPEPIARLSAADESRLRALLQRHGGRDSLGYFALRRDKSVVWSATGKAAITYRVVHGVALASGDPIGDPEAWPGAIAAYRALVEEYGWTPAVIGASELGATVFKREYGLNALELGDEAILDVAEFSLDGRAMRGVRQACTRVGRAGYEVRVRRASEIGPEEFAQLCSAAESWRGDAVERGFSMALSRLGDPSDPDCVIASACRDGQLRGLLHFVPWGPCGLSLDLMRRDRAADNGLNEFMIEQVVAAGPSLGVGRVSLNFAVFRDALERGERIGAGPILRAWRRVLLFASRWWQIESLYRFNVKFRPYWEPRFISFPSSRDLPRIAVAGLEAEAFLVRPHRLKRLLGRG
jgi:lysyl-tRNA synthetase class 2